MPQHLTAKDINSIVYVFSKMSVSARLTFLAGLLTEHPEHYVKVCNALGDQYFDTIASA
jgi:hypothetical protein